jgi:hypothetical protein
MRQELQSQAEIALAALVASKAEGRGPWGALGDALKNITVVDRTTSGRPAIVTYHLADGSRLQRRATEPILHAEAGAPF